MNELLLFLIGIGMVQGVLLGIYLILSSEPARMATKIIGIFLLIVSLIMASEVSEFFGLEDRMRSYLQIFILFDILLPPLYWLFCLFLLEQKIKISSHDWWHGLPFLLGLIWYFTGFQWYGNESPGTFSHIPDAVAFLVFCKGLVITFYIFYIGKKIFAFEKGKTKPKQKDRIRLLKRIFWFFLTLSCITYFFFWGIYFGITFRIDSDYLGCLIMTAFVYFLSYNILKQPDLLVRQKQKTEISKYSKSTLDVHSRLNYQNQLLSFLETEKPFLDKKLSLSDLANSLNLSSNTLSQVINEGLKMNFHDLINEFRLKEFKKKLSDPRQSHKTILALAYESGFQSKASFNRIFKKMEGISPSSFRNQQLNRTHPTQ